jgi:hypothetical protein
VAGRYEDIWSKLNGESSDEHRHMYQVLELVDGLQRRTESDFESALRAINDTTVDSVPGAPVRGNHPGRFRGHSLDRGRDAHLSRPARRYPTRRRGGRACRRPGTSTSSASTISPPTCGGRGNNELHSSSPRCVPSCRSSCRVTRRTSPHSTCMPSRLTPSTRNPLSWALFSPRTIRRLETMRSKEQFINALASRDLIGQAKGHLALRHQRGRRVRTTPQALAGVQHQTRRDRPPSSVLRLLDRWATSTSSRHRLGCAVR